MSLGQTVNYQEGVRLQMIWASGRGESGYVDQQNDGSVTQAMYASVFVQALVKAPLADC